MKEKPDAIPILKSGSLILDLLQPIDFHEYHQPVDRLWGGLAFLTSPVFQPPNSGLRGQTAFPEVIWHSNLYGTIGSVRIRVPSDRGVRLEYWPSPLPSVQDVIPYETAIRDLLPRTPVALSDLFRPLAESRPRYAEMLFDVRLDLLRQVRSWLINHLRILGIDTPYPNLHAFVFPIKGTPAQFGILAREITTRSMNLSGQKVTCQARKPGSLFELGSIPSDANPIEVRLTLGKVRLDIQASSLPDKTTLLRVSNLNGHREWELWVLLRDEMERLQYYDLPAAPQPLPPAPAEERSVLLAMNTVVSQPWLKVPDVGSSREIVRLWHENLTCKEIAVRLGCTEKTIINRINLLRNQYGKEIVPYRRATAKNSPT